MSIMDELLWISVEIANILLHWKIMIETTAHFTTDIGFNFKRKSYTFTKFCTPVVFISFNAFTFRLPADAFSYTYRILWAWSVVLCAVVLSYIDNDNNSNNSQHIHC